MVEEFLNDYFRTGEKHDHVDTGGCNYNNPSECDHANRSGLERSSIFRTGAGHGPSGIASYAKSMEGATRSARTGKTDYSHDCQLSAGGRLAGRGGSLILENQKKYPVPPVIIF